MGSNRVPCTGRQVLICWTTREVWIFLNERQDCAFREYLGKSVDSFFPITEVRKAGDHIILRHLAAQDSVCLLSELIFLGHNLLRSFLCVI